MCFQGQKSDAASRARFEGFYTTPESVCSITMMPTDGPWGANGSNNMEELLWNGEAQCAKETLRSLNLREETSRAHRDTPVGYYTNNLFRMDYPKYRENGWANGSGAIESAHKTAIQQRLKMSGQRWRTRGAQSVLCLRTCMLNGNWNYIRNIIQECSAA